MPHLVTRERLQLVVRVVCDSVALKHDVGVLAYRASKDHAVLPRILRIRNRPERCVDVNLGCVRAVVPGSVEHHVEVSGVIASIKRSDHGLRETWAKVVVPRVDGTVGDAIKAGAAPACVRVLGSEVCSIADESGQRQGTCQYNSEG